MIDCTIIVVAYRSTPDVVQLITSIPGAVGGLTWQALVVDNDNSDDLAAALVGHPTVRVIRSLGNLGYSGGLNLGLHHSPPSRYTVFLNPDLSLSQGSLSALAGSCDSGRCAAAVPLLLDEIGTPQMSLRREPTVRRAFGEALFGDRWPGRPAWLSETVRSTRSYRAVGSVDWATGAALMVRNDILADVGLWDSARFFLYSEETDYARRVRELGHEIRFTPTAVVRHRGAGSGSSPELDALLAINKVRYFRKWNGKLRTLAFAGAILLHSGLRITRAESRLAIRSLFSARSRASLPGGMRSVLLPPLGGELRSEQRR